MDFRRNKKKITLFFYHLNKGVENYVGFFLNDLLGS